MIGKVFLVFFLMHSVLLSASSDYMSSLKEAAMLLSQEDYRGRNESLEKLLKQDLPPWMQAGIYAEMASAYLKLQENTKAVEFLSRAIELGYDDCLSLKEDPITTLQSNPEFQKQYESIRISPADLLELFWLKKELQTVDHEIKMMITENINRADTSATEIHQSMIPVRKTSSPGVLYMREVLAMYHAVQFEVVQKSDTQRMQHVANMSIINGGLNQEAMLRSVQEASNRAEDRKREVKNREFRIDPNASTEPQPCPAD